MSEDLSDYDELDSADALLTNVKRAGFPPRTTEEASTMSKPKPQHLKNEQILRFFNISPHEFQNRWRPIIYTAVRKMSNIKSDDGRLLPWYEVSHTPTNLAKMSELESPLNELWETLPGFTRPLCTSAQATWKDGQDTLPGCSVTQLSILLAKLIKRECTRVRTLPELQGQATENDLQIRNVVNKSVSPEKRPSKELVPKKLKGRGVLYLVPFTHEAIWQKSQAERNQL